LESLRMGEVAFFKKSILIFKNYFIEAKGL